MGRAFMCIKQFSNLIQKSNKKDGCILYDLNLLSSLSEVYLHKQTNSFFQEMTF